MLVDMTSRPLTPLEQNELATQQALEDHVRSVGHADWCGYITSNRQAACTCGASPGWRPGKIIEQPPQ